MIAPDLTLPRELARKAIHLTSAAVPAAYAAGLPRHYLTYLLATGAALAVMIEGARLRVPRVRRLFDRAVGPLLRRHEHVRISGATWLVVALLIAALVLPRDLAIATMWAAAVGDPVAAIVGRSVGRLRPRPEAKSLEGALACLAMTAAGAWLLAGLPIAWALGAGAAAALAEWPREPFDDNLRITVAVGGFLLALRMFAA